MDPVTLVPTVRPGLCFYLDHEDPSNIHQDPANFPRDLGVVTYVDEEEGVVEFRIISDMKPFGEAADDLTNFQNLCSAGVYHIINA